MAVRGFLSPLARTGLAVSGVVVVVDQITKWIVLGPLGLSPEGCRHNPDLCGGVEISPIFDLTMLWNEGVSFGLLRAGSEAGRWALTALSLAIAAVMVSWLRTVERPLTAYALGAVIGGAVGNVIDRVRFGAVVDFFDFSGLFFPWIFNVADAAISVGVAVLLLDLLLEGRERAQAG